MQNEFRHLVGAAVVATALLGGPASAKTDIPAHPCGTVDLLAAWRAGAADPRLAGMRSLLRGPRFQAFTTPDGRFVLHYGKVSPGRPLSPARLARQGLPPAVARVRETLEAGRLLLVERGGWPGPGSGRPVEVVLIDGDGAGPSRVVPETDPVLSPEEGSQVRMIVAGPPDSWADQALHQYVHALQIGQSAHEALWLYEAGALAVEARLTGEDPVLPGLPAALETTHRTVFGGGRDIATATLFLDYLGHVHGENVLRDVWRQAARRYGPNSLQALDSTLRLSDLTTLKEAWRAFSIWLAYPDAAERPALPGRLPEVVPPARPAHVIITLPDGHLGDGPLQVEPFGIAYIHLRDLGDAGAVRLELETGNDAAVAADVLLSWKHAPLGWMVVPVSLEGGRGEIVLPVEADSRAVVVVRNQEPLSGLTVDVAFAASAEPTFPFDLAFLAADAWPGRIDLSWGSDTESRMYGWIVYRASDPQGPFRPVNRLPIPSMGDSDAPLAYHFTDERVVPGRRYYYLVEGITLDGLARRSPVVASRAAPDPERTNGSPPRQGGEAGRGSRTPSTAPR